MYCIALWPRLLVIFNSCFLCMSKANSPIRTIQFILSCLSVHSHMLETDVGAKISLTLSSDIIVVHRLFVLYIYVIGKCALKRVDQDLQGNPCMKTSRKSAACKDMAMICQPKQSFRIKSFHKLIPLKVFSKARCIKLCVYMTRSSFWLDLVRFVAWRNSQ